MKPYKQTSSQSCLSVCLLQNIDEEITSEKELELLYEGLRTTDPYSISVISVFTNKYHHDVLIYVDNNYYREILYKSYASDQIKFIYNKINASFLESLKPPYIAYLNTNTLLGTWDYSPHFVTIESMTDIFFTILESISGKRMKVSKNKLTESIATLRDRIRYCPLVIKVNK